MKCNFWLSDKAYNGLMDLSGLSAQVPRERSASIRGGRIYGERRNTRGLGQWVDLVARVGEFIDNRPTRGAADLEALTMYSNNIMQWTTLEPRIARMLNVQPETVERLDKIGWQLGIVPRRGSGPRSILLEAVGLKWVQITLTNNYNYRTNMKIGEDAKDSHQLPKMQDQRTADNST